MTDYSKHVAQGIMDDQKYLTKELLESSGWKYIGAYRGAGYGYQKGEFELCVDHPNKTQIEIAGPYSIGLKFSDKGFDTIFRGRCTDIETLNLLEELLSIDDETWESRIRDAIKKNGSPCPRLLIYEYIVDRTGYCNLLVQTHVYRTIRIMMDKNTLVHNGNNEYSIID